jgi:branched-chain amino acid transport system permease protein
MKLSRIFPLIPVLVVYCLFVIIGLVVPGNWQLISMLAFYCAVGQAFNIFLGMTGYVDFGYVAFLAMGSYGMALGISAFYQEGLGIGVVFIGLVLGGLMGAILSLAVGAVALRLRGAYFAIATIGVNEGFRYLIEGTGIWGGSKGLIFSGQLRDALGRELAAGVSTFWVDIGVILIGITAACVTLYYLKNRVGYALLALREDEEAAGVMGINVTRYKIQAFVTSAFFAGLIGALAWGLKLTYVFPSDVFEINYTIEAIIIVVLGGAGTLLGPLIGALIYGLSRYWLSVALPGYQLLIFAPLIIIVIMLFPGGLVGLIKNKTAGTFWHKFIV